MKKKEGNLLEKLLQSKKHPVRQKFITIFLCLCLSVASLPMELFGFQVLAEDIQRQITYFLPLSEEIRQQIVSVGTEWKDLELPNNLTVMSTFSIGGNVEFLEQEDESLKEEVTEIENVTWTCGSVYDSSTEGIYTFQPVFPENYSMAEQIELPVIQVTVIDMKTVDTKHQDQQELQTESEREDKIFLEDEGREERSLEDEIEKNKSLEDESEKKRLSEDVEEKRFSEDVIEGEEDEIIMTAEDDWDLETEPKTIEVTQDAAWEDIWEEGYLNVTIVIKEGVTLTLNKKVVIGENVTIEGGGKIVRENPEASFQVGGDYYDDDIDFRPTLVIHGVTLDGNSVSSTYNFIGVKAGSLVLDQGCVIEKVKSGLDTYGAVSAVYISSHSTGVLGDITIQNCYGEAVGTGMINLGQVTINGGNYINNRSKNSGGCIYNSSQLTINGGTFSDNYAETNGGVISNFSKANKGKANLIINGGTFLRNKSGSNGGCISSVSNTNLEIHGGSFIENESKYGGAVDSYGTLIVDGGYFKNNRNFPEREGGAIYYTGFYEEDFSLSGEAVFFGTENGSDSYTDSVYLKFLEKMNSKGPILHPVNIYLPLNGSNPVVEGTEGYVIQKGDLKNIHIFDVANPQKKWYNRLETQTNQIFVTDIEPEEEQEEQGEKTFTAYFYSGTAGKNKIETVNKEQSAVSATLIVPDLEEMPGWTAVGWSTDIEDFEQRIMPGSEIILKEPATKYYGIYQKEVMLSYDTNHGSNKLEKDIKFSYANVHEETTYKIPEFTIASIENQEGYVFVGWNTKADGTGEEYEAGSIEKFDHDVILYAVWEENPDAVVYQVEHYKQDVEGDGYTKADTDTETLMEIEGTEVEAKGKEYQGFTLNHSHPLGISKGIVKKDGSLVLKLYYDRNIYEVDFNLNGGYGKVPDTQKVRYGGLLKSVEHPVRAGYHFKGWYLDKEEQEDGLWDFEEPVENNTETLHTSLFAKWQDELAPVMEEASFQTGYKSFLNWALQKKSLTITVPVIEEGSGLSKAEYLFVAEDGTEKDGLAEIIEKHTLSNRMLAYGTGASVLRAMQDKAEQGKYEVRIPIEEEFKGKVYLTCTDLAGNVSAQKILTAAGGGVIIEDNAPEISFSDTEEKTAKPVTVTVLVEDHKNGNISGGISEISYQIDKEEKAAIPEEEFSQAIVESYDFKVKISGEGKHTLWVGAMDHAGNKSEAKVTLKINQKQETPIETPNQPKDPETPTNFGNPGNSGDSGYPKGSEPKTGDNFSGYYVEVCATVAMIAGFGYLLLYFHEENGITEQKKEEIVYRLVKWAKQGGKFRRMIGLAIIFLFLAYYHSIGKSVTVEWREVCTEGVRKNSGF